ncbi:radical SAM protein [Clostridium tetanomorphum]|nr:radical SAM protein [Clostridium tetanomorphum]
MNRYSIIKNKNRREIVLLKAFPCFWGKCSFCDYIKDNSLNEADINNLNFKVLNNITGKYKALEIINSGSCFELPKNTLERIKEITKEKK